MIDRLPYDATTREEVRQYFMTRALQMASCNIVWLGDLSEPTEGCYITHFFDPELDQRYSSFYITAPHRGKGKAVRAVKLLTYPIITIADCNIVEFLTRVGANFRVVEGVFDTIEYKMVEKFYGTGRPKRAPVYLMNHIDEGLFIMSQIGASKRAMQAFCLHPLLQNDPDLAENFDVVVAQCDRVAVALAMEYRNIANQWLSDKVWIEDGLAPCVTWDAPPKLSPLLGVNRMLIADKIQNYKDFIKYHKGTHARSVALDKYFQVWLEVLEIDDFQKWVNEIESIVPTRFTNQGA